VHAAIIASWAELSRWMSWSQGAQPTVQELRARFAGRGAGFADRSDLTYSMFKKHAGTFVGAFSLFRFDWTVPRCEMGYWLATDQTGNGYATETLKVLTAFAWTLGLVRVEMRCDAMN
jgi:RimJ/RimL family protein N-acetyltransferase